MLDELCRIPISRFYRDRAVFDTLRSELLPHLAAGALARGGRTLRACPGAGVFLLAEYERSATGSSAIGERGRPAEAVASEAAHELLALHRAGACIDAHLGDQLLVPAARVCVEPVAT